MLQDPTNSTSISADIEYNTETGPVEKEAKEIKEGYLRDIHNMEGYNRSIKILNNIYQRNKFDLNRKNDNLMKIVSDPELLMSSYHKLKSNKGSMTTGTDETTADEMTFSRIQELSKQILENKFKWSNIRRVFIPKPGKSKKHPLGIPNFIDRIVQENIRIILNAIYEPLFQNMEVNYGFRPKRSTSDAIKKISLEKQSMTTAIEGDIKGAYDNVNHKILMRKLKRKISDKKFLKLIEDGLSAGLLEKGKVIETTTGVPQGGIASPILFNIYMHDFDEYVVNTLTEIFEKVNKVTKRTSDKNMSKRYMQMKSKQDTAKRSLNRMGRTYRKITVNEKGTEKTIDSVKYHDPIRYKDVRKRMRYFRRKKSHIKLTSQAKTLLRFSYTRYADDWIILTNANKTTCEYFKNILSDWLRNELVLELSEEKTLITDVFTETAKFLGYTLRYSRRRLMRRVRSVQTTRTFKKTINIGFCVMLDHERIRKRLINEGLMNQDLKPIHCKKYCSLKPWQVVEKFKQKVMGLFNYYYYNLTYKSELHLYYYIIRYSCLKTLAFIQKSSSKKVLMKYGKNLNIQYQTSYKNKKGQIIIKQNNIGFISYKNLMVWCQEIMINQIKKYTEKTVSGKTLQTPHINIIKKRQKLVQRITLREVLLNPYKTMDPFTTTNINLRTSFKLQRWCCICGEPNSKSNPIEAHHLKHIKKGKISGFSEVMKALNRRTIPVCHQCHLNIHKGKYDGLALREFFDPIIAEL